MTTTKIPLNASKGLDESIRKRRLNTGAMLELWLWCETPEEVIEDINYPINERGHRDPEFVILFPRAADSWHAQELANALGEKHWRSLEFRYEGVACLAVVVYR